MFIEGTGYRDVHVVSRKYEDDRLVEVSIDEFERGTNAISTETVVKTYDDQGQLVSERVMVDGVDIGQVGYTYEKSSCLQLGSADPSNVIEVESARLHELRVVRTRLGRRCRTTEGPGGIERGIIGRCVQSK